ncbi:hypothetical protein BU24DRAFT_469755 [Aaosphaeria arxii CBS 175.79]|uniref:Aminoglycoside phosphotransferase domain-containing protein n=1 Tax=Aaosphaeria arxii CBS 175.79 TaxID=1450172 RepID=A0A6A5Y8T9_9PLEO|nr:uncharacterized protein BU24DRAFT_469755 [Aaosphaeria arxii CBS 175.79]KAF2020994.1 hypothetical protein BU24DRAFT_469755 [Aaosphaeria arxii CBS 175.79]
MTIHTLLAKLGKGLLNIAQMITSDRNHERITNEARALKLVSQETSIPAPRLLDHGSHPDGRRYLITEYIEGPTLSSFSRRSCSMPEGKKHTTATPCQTCSDTAHSNAVHFILHTVLPQLTKLTSRTRGIDGFVMPPSWLSPDAQPPWIGKQSWSTLPLEQPEYVFQHGDLAAHNIIMDRVTLQAKALIDWEYAGFYPAGMENWTGTLDRDVYSARSDDTAHLIQRFLAVEYAECCHNWGDKAELHELIELGKLPQPDQIRQNKTEQKNS